MCKQFNRYTKLCNEKEREGTSQLNREIERVTRQKYRNKKKTKMKDLSDRKRERANEKESY